MSSLHPNEYDLGQLAILTNFDPNAPEPRGFLNSLGVAVDPPRVLVYVKDPAEVVTPYEFGIAPALEKLAVGQYRLTIKPHLRGDWWYGWQAIDTTNPIQAAMEGAQLQGRFYVLQSPFI